jgi:hypothetical protein
MADPDAIDLADVVQALKPYLPALVETIGLAGAAFADPQEKDSEGVPLRKPGDVRAASIGLDLVTKYLSGHGGDKASRVIRELAALGLDEEPEGIPRPHHTNPPPEGTPLE